MSVKNQKPQKQKIRSVTFLPQSLKKCKKFFIKNVYLWKPEPV